MRVSPEFELQLRGYGLTTARIFYHMPDFHSVLQTYVWQEFDIAPDFPQLRKFLDFWTRSLEGPLHSVLYAHRRLIGPNEWTSIDGEFSLH